ncbi:hypothetical protein [uncultured Methanobrevibacter sp.]|uniref:hypothetical protein n=1 Tax=uncultured Methanobrevibacter sp. TaxID=253161 RepID=UPI0026145C86|nr:hypothetical protein [uncultured Methanobrevibacter sp.]
MKIVLVSSLALSVLLIVYPQAILFLYSVKNVTHIPVVLNALRIFAISYFGTAITFMYTFYAQAIQKNQLSQLFRFLKVLYYQFPLQSY